MKTIACITIAGLVVATGHAQTIDVDAGETLTQADLEAGMFMGQSFTLGMETVFNINDGGAIGPVGETDVFDFMGASVNVNTGGLFASRSQFEDLALNLFDGGLVEEGNSRSEGNSIINMSGGVLDDFTASGDTILNITGGTFRNEPIMGPDSTTNLFVTNLSLDGSPLDLDLGDTVSIDTSENFLLEVTLADGTPVMFERSGSGPVIPLPTKDGLASVSGTLTATLVPAPASASLVTLAGLSLVRRRR